MKFKNIKNIQDEVKTLFLFFLFKPAAKLLNNFVHSHKLRASDVMVHREILNVVILTIRKFHRCSVITGRKFWHERGIRKRGIYDFEVSFADTNLQQIFTQCFGHGYNCIDNWKWFQMLHNVAPIKIGKGNLWNIFVVIVFAVNGDKDLIYDISLCKKIILFSKAFQTLPFGTSRLRVNPWFISGWFLL